MRHVITVNKDICSMTERVPNARLRHACPAAARGGGDDVLVCRFLFNPSRVGKHAVGNSQPD